MGRIEILSGRERRRVWTNEQKRASLEEAVASGLPLAAVARRHDIVPQQIYSWRRELGRSGPPTFVPVALVAPDGGEPNACMKAAAPKRGGRRGGRAAQIEIHCVNGRILKVEAGLANEMLKALIRSVEDA